MRADDSEELQERIHVRAYYLWLSENCPTDHDLDVWLRAQELERVGADPRTEDPSSEMEGSSEPRKPAAGSASARVDDSVGEAAKSQEPGLAELKAQLASKAM